MSARPAGAAGVAAAGLLLTVASSLAARGGQVSRPERAVFRAVNELPDRLQRPMWLAQLAGVLAAPLVVAGVALLRRRWRLALALGLLPPAKLIAERMVLKQLVERQRPGRTEPGAILRDVPAAGLSFPSGHAIVAAGVATLLWPYLGTGGRIVVAVVVTANSVARVYLGAHNPLDQLAGIGLGLLLGGLLTMSTGVRTGQ